MTLPTPAFVLEEEALLKNLRILREVQDRAGCTIILALKGFALFHSFPMVRKYLPGTTASSLFEAQLGHAEFGGAVHACAPVYRPSEMPELLPLVSHITFNSLSEWERYRPLVAAAKKPVSAALRINPEHAEVATDLYNPGMPGSRLGVSATELGPDLPEGIEGLHFHTLCECGADALDRTWEKLESDFGPLLKQARWLNMGGGHLITRDDYDVERLIARIQDIRARYDVDIILEPGAAVAWRTGYLVASVLDRVERRGIRTLMLDVSFSAHMPDCLEMPYHPTVRGARLAAENESGWRLGGMTCLAGDWLGDYVFDQDPGVGDRLIFEDMMHYTMVKTTMFNGVPHPAIACQKIDGSVEVWREFTYADYRARIG